MDISGISRQNSENHFQQRGFSAPVAPDKPDFLSGVYLQIEPVENHLRLE
jgi:hypothetical protein